MSIVSLNKARELLAKCTFKIQIEYAKGQWWWGTGFFASQNGFALTAYHNLPCVVQQTRKDTLRAWYKQQWLELEFIDDLSLESADVAVFKLNNPAKGFIQTLRLACPSISFERQQRVYY